MNLVNNAIKFTPRGEVIVRVTAADLPDSLKGDHQEDRFAARVAVSDTGIGIAPDRLNRLFKSFSQVDASTQCANSVDGARPGDLPPGNWPS